MAKAKYTLPEDVADRLGVLSETLDLMKPDEAAEAMHNLAIDLIGALPFRARLRIAIRMSLRRLGRRLRFWKE